MSYKDEKEKLDKWLKKQVKSRKTNFQRSYARKFITQQLTNCFVSWADEYIEIDQTKPIASARNAAKMAILFCESTSNYYKIHMQTAYELDQIYLYWQIWITHRLGLNSKKQKTISPKWWRHLHKNVVEEIKLIKEEING